MVFAEAKDKIEMLKGWAGIQPGKPIFATPPAFKEAFPGQPEKWPVYKFKPADGIDFNEDLDDPELYQVDGGKVILNSGRFRMQKLRRGVLDWKGHVDADDVAIPCERDENGLTEASLRSMSSTLQDWALNVIASADKVTREESDGLKF